MKKIKKFLTGCLENIKKVKTFLTSNIDDLFIMLGMLVIVIASYICFGIGTSLFILGFFLISLGIIDFSRLRR